MSEPDRVPLSVIAATVAGVSIVYTIVSVLLLVAGRLLTGPEVAEFARTDLIDELTTGQTVMTAVYVTIVVLVVAAGVSPRLRRTMQRLLTDLEAPR